MKTQTIEAEKIGAYCKVSEEYLKIGREEDDFAYDLLTARLHGFIYSMAKEEGEITVYAERPKFLDWLLRRRKPIVVKYVIKELVKADKMKFPDNIRVIQIPIIDDI